MRAAVSFRCRRWRWWPTWFPLGATHLTFVTEETTAEKAVALVEALESGGAWDVTLRLDP